MQNDGGYGGVPFFLRYPLSSTHYPPSLSFHTVVHSLHSFAKERNSTLLLSWASALFHKNTGCGGKEHTTYQGLRNSRDGLRQFANFLLELLAVAAAIGKRRAQPGMKFARPRLPRHRSPAAATNSARTAAPSGALLAPPDVRILCAPVLITSPSACRRSEASSKAR